MPSMPLLRSRLASARAKRTRFASSKALRRSSELLSGARLSIGFTVYQCSLSTFSNRALQIPRAQAVLLQIRRELLEHLAWLQDEASRPYLHRRSPREHELNDVRTARHPANPDHRQPNRSRDLVDRPQGYRLYRGPREPAAQKHFTL